MRRAVSFLAFNELASELGHIFLINDHNFPPSHWSSWCHVIETPVFDWSIMIPCPYFTTLIGPSICLGKTMFQFTNWFPGNVCNTFSWNYSCPSLWGGYFWVNNGLFFKCVIITEYKYSYFRFNTKSLVISDVLVTYSTECFLFFW